MSFTASKFFICLFLILGSQATYSQSAYGGKGENRLNTAWAYYGRGNGLSILYDHGFSDWFSAGAGVELYFIESERETSFFGIMDFHLQQALDLPERLDLYPGTEIGHFNRNFALYPYLGVSWALSEEFGLFTELGERGTLGVYFNF
ncbi:MAG TPA: hypothetical protein VLL47_10070 [Robiginitalea sp.]|nr:hypothetical protein [Robiginitalea sp.]